MNMSPQDEWSFVQLIMQPPKSGSKSEYPTPEQRGPVPENAHPDANFSSHLHDDWTHAQRNSAEYPAPELRGPVPQNAHPDDEFKDVLHGDYFSMHLKDKSQVQLDA